MLYFLHTKNGLIKTTPKRKGPSYHQNDANNGFMGIYHV